MSVEIPTFLNSRFLLQDGIKLIIPKDPKLNSLLHTLTQKYKT